MVNTLVELRIAIPADILEVLRARTATVGMTPEQWLASRAHAAALRDVEHDMIVRLWELGLTDAEIARRLDVTNAFVSKRRRERHLPANRRKRHS